MPRLPRKTWISIALLAVVIGARLLGWELQPSNESPERLEPARTSERAPDRPGGDFAPARGDELERLVAERRSGVMVESEGQIVAVLPDDQKGSRHQRLLVKIASGGTILIAHNIDLAPRIERPDRGDRIAFRGQYEWNEKGGVIHWTHHDPDGRHEEGWLRHDGRTYE
jgi:hypothetical protein